MRVENNINNNEKDKQTMVFKVGNDQVKLNPGIVRKYLVNGQGSVTDQEIVYFMHLCKSRQLNPFTNEAQVNDRIPMVNFPFTVCHEMAHQTGIGSESECNFIGYLAAINNSDDYFQYAAYTTAVRYCFRNLEEIEEGKSKLYLEKLNKGVLKNFDENEVFWKEYETPINTFFEYFYDNFLKANQQKDGLESYSKFIGLLIGYEKINM